MSFESLQEYIAPVVVASMLSFGGYTINGLNSLNSKVATINSEQIVDKRVNEEVRVLSDVISRMDENIKHIKENQVRAYELLLNNNVTLEKTE